MSLDQQQQRHDDDNHDEEIPMLLSSQPIDQRKYKSTDFGYILEKQSNNTSITPFTDVKYDSKDEKTDSKKMAGILVFSSGCCCFIAFALIAAGAFLLAYNPNNSEQHGTGAILLAIGIMMLLLCIILCCMTLCVACAAGFSSKKTEWDITRLNDRFDSQEEEFEEIRYNFDDSGDFNIKKRREEEDKKKEEDEKSKQKEMEKMVMADLEKGESYADIMKKRRPVVFKIDFDGDISVSTIDSLRDQISLCIRLGSQHDIVCIVITSPGGSVTMYGLAASQIMRIRKAGMKAVACVDSVAASGGYLMASVADYIYAAPFSMVGSIGVISIVPNIHKLLQHHRVETYVMTAGKYKSTVNLIGEVTEEGKDKAKEELEDIHQIFKDHICANRPKLSDKIDDIATGEAWLAVEGKRLGLVDELMTSDEYLSFMSKTHDVISIEPRRNKPWISMDSMVGFKKLYRWYRDAQASNLCNNNETLMV